VRRLAIALAGVAALGAGAVAPLAAPQDGVSTDAEVRRAKAEHSTERVPLAEKLRRELRAERRRAERLRRAILRETPGTPAERHLEAIAACESGDDPDATSAGGLYRGKHQFDMRTWSAVGGRGDPAAATETEQDWRALLLYQRRGNQPWPVCG
jgi:Transglycosylase-like domain